MRSSARAAALLLPFAFASCDDSAGPLLQARVPSSLELADDLVVDDGDTVALALTVYDQRGRAYRSVPDGAALVGESDDASIADFDDEGRLVGAGPGATTVRVRLGTLEAEASVIVRSVARQIVVVTPPSGDLLPSAPVPGGIVIRVVDRHGGGVAGVDVEFRVTDGGGSVAPGTVATDDGGFASAEWTLGPLIGRNALEAFVAGVPDTVALEASISQVVAAGFLAPTTVGVGATLPVGVRLDTEAFPTPIGAAHLVVSWDPAVLALRGEVGSGDYDLVRGRLDADAGRLHLLAVDAAPAPGAVVVADLTFDVIGGAGPTALSLDVAQLVGVDFRDVSSAAVVQSATVQVTP